MCLRFTVCRKRQSKCLYCCFLDSRSHGTRRIWDWTNICSNTPCVHTRPTKPDEFATKKIRSRFLRDRSEILTNPREQRNRSFSRLICTVWNWNEVDNDIKPGLSNKLTRSIDVLKTTTKM